MPKAKLNVATTKTKIKHYVNIQNMALSMRKEIMIELKKYSLAVLFWLIVCESISFFAIKFWGDSFHDNLHPNGYFVSENNPCSNCTGYIGLSNNRYKDGGARMIDEYGNMVSKPVTITKDSNCFRVLLEAGSAGWGSGETWSVTHDKTYFQGSYAFESTIAGLIEKELQLALPNKKVEVINGAVVGHDIQQHFAKYITLDHLFKPDVVVTIAGYNDGISIGIGSCTSSNQMINNYIERAAIVKSSRFPFTVSLINRAIAGFGNKGAGKGLENYDGDWYDGEGIDFYKKVESRLTQNSQPLLRIIDAYAAQIKKDGSYHIFCLQPILHRRDIQKKLTPLETKFRETIEENKEGVLLPYFFGLNLAPHIDTIMAANGGSFIDLGKVITSADEKTDVYMDYCHLTFVGNQLCAHAIAKQILEKRNPLR